VRQAIDVFPNSQAVIEGHTDSYGGDESNMALSRRRAEAVSGYLTNELGVPAFRLSAVGYGETRPIANNETAQGRERNRRIDVRIQPQLQ
jgi:OOP family OmpA-OmpF porin